MNYTDLVKEVQAHDNTKQGLPQNVGIENISRKQLPELSQRPT